MLAYRFAARRAADSSALVGTRPTNSSTVAQTAITGAIRSAFSKTEYHCTATTLMICVLCGMQLRAQAVGVEGVLLDNAPSEQGDQVLRGSPGNRAAQHGGWGAAGKIIDAHILIPGAVQHQMSCSG